MTSTMDSWNDDVGTNGLGRNGNTRKKEESLRKIISGLGDFVFRSKPSYVYRFVIGVLFSFPLFLCFCALRIPR